MPKNRGFNFSELEKRELLNIIDKYKDIVENKKTDSVTIKHKQDCWNKIAVEYNSIIVDRPREMLNLKGCYNNMKRYGKKNILNDRYRDYIENLNINDLQGLFKNIKKEAIKTEGDTYQEKSNTLDTFVLAMCPEKATSPSNSSNDMVIDEENEQSFEIDQNITNADEIGDHITQNLKINKQKRKGHMLIDQLSKYANEKIRKLEQDISLTKTYNEKKMEMIDLQMKHQKEEHEAKMTLLNIELKIKTAELERTLKG